MHKIIKIIAALAAVLLLALAIAGVVRLVTATVNIISTDGGETVADPMFAQEAELTTRPPELYEESGSAFTDNSANWDLGEQNPVDMTAEELARISEGENAAG